MIYAILIVFFISANGLTHAGNNHSALHSAVVTQKYKKKVAAAAPTQAKAPACPYGTTHLNEQKVLGEISTKILAINDAKLIPPLVQIITSYLGLCTHWKQKKIWNTDNSVRSLIAVSPDRFVVESVSNDASYNWFALYDRVIGQVREISTPLGHIPGEYARAAVLDSERLAVCSAHSCSIEGITDAHKSIVLQNSRLNKHIADINPDLRYNYSSFVFVLLPNNRLASCHDDCHVKIWSTVNGALIRDLYTGVRHISHLIAMVNGDLLVVSDNKTCRIDPTAIVGKEIKWTQENFSSPKTPRSVGYICFLSNGNILFAEKNISGHQYIVYQRDPNDGSTVSCNSFFSYRDTLELDGCIHEMVALPNNKAAAAFENRVDMSAIIIIDPSKLAITAKLKGHSSPVNRLLLHDEQTLISSSGYDAQIIVWDLVTNAVRQKLSRNTQRVKHCDAQKRRSSLATLSSERFVSSCDEEGEITLWEQEPCVCVEPVNKSKS